MEFLFIYFITYLPGESFWVEMGIDITWDQAEAYILIFISSFQIFAFTELLERTTDVY